jgi:hypothetical protein
MKIRLGTKIPRPAVRPPLKREPLGDLIIINMEDGGSEESRLCCYEG